MDFIQFFEIVENLNRPDLQHINKVREKTLKVFAGSPESWDKTTSNAAIQYATNFLDCYDLPDANFNPDEPRKFLKLHDVCSSDYFTGSSLPYWAISVDGSTNGAEIIELLKDEYDNTFEIYESEVNETAFKLALKELEGGFKNNDLWNAPVFPDLPINEDCEDTYAYFIFSNIN